MIYAYLKEGALLREECTPDFDEKTDVLVAGVGTAGTFAAISAAREGASVIAVERELAVGGMYTAGRVTGFYYGDEGGTYEECEREADELDKAFFGSRKKPEGRVAVYTEKLSEFGVKLYTGAAVMGLYIENDTVTGARIVTQDTTFNVRARVLIDATSDGHAVRLLSIPLRFGRGTDGGRAPFTVWSDVIKDGKRRGMNVDDGYCDQYEPYSFSDAVVSAHARKLLFLKDGAEYLSVASLPGVREGLSFLGEETLKYTDILSSKEPRRVLFYARSDLDKHGSDIALDEDEYQNFWCVSNLATLTVRIPVPMGAVMPKGVRGILTAGRCLSVDSYALGAVRMNRDMMRMGECVGILAALSVKHGCDVRDVDYGEYERLTDVYGCRRGKMTESFAFDAPSGKNVIGEPVERRAVSFDMTHEKIIEELATDSPGVAIYACRLSDGSIIPKLVPLLASDDEKLALGAALALGLMGDGSGADVLRHAVRCRSSEIFTGCRRSNQFKSCAAICVLARFGTKEDMDLLSEIVFDKTERKKAMYVPENTSPLAYGKTDVRFCYFQHFTHALIAMCKIAKREGVSDELLSRIKRELDGEKTSELVDFVTFGRADAPIGAATRAAVEYSEKILR
ncbi:MAG: FAD-dependent oxidoreductase [Clostridia bacterium]|nr:FAD-dependent oxidoreductase [Clostridia bacterium]